MDEWARPGELDVFATGGTTLVDRGADPGAGRLGDAIRRTGVAVRDVHARPGHRPGVRTCSLATTSGRRSGPADIVHSVMVDPRVAATIALDRLFRDPLPGLEVDTDVPDDDLRFLVWHGRLVAPHLGSVSVSLHLLASPSLVVTVLELVPQRSVRWHRRAFVQSGVRAVETLASRLHRLAA